MTIKSDKEVRIPVYLFSVVMPLIIVLVGTYVTSAKLQATTQVKMENIQKELDTLKSAKADNTILIIFRDQLNRIEKKLDDHISQKK